ncbi:RDD family protein [Candidatus Shapirobacteria bacterium]|nr:RDD family protein [Candidatus Shapirobacteria bacterium]
MKNKASVALRLMAGLIDFLLIAGFFLFLVWRLASAGTILDLLNSLLTILTFLFLTILAPFINSYLICRLGGTIGKLLTGTRIVNPEGKKVSFWRAFLRNYLGYMVSSMLLWLGFIWIAIDKERRGWHDLMADTYVVVVNKAGAVIGMLSLLILLLANIFLGFEIFRSISGNVPFYQSVINDISKEFQQSLNTPQLL